MGPTDAVFDASNNLIVSFNLGTEVPIATYVDISFTQFFDFIAGLGATMVWAYGFLTIFVGPYDAFHLRLQLLKSFYSVDSDEKHGRGHLIDTDESDIRLSLAEMLSHRKEYDFTFWTNAKAKFACYCLRRKCHKAVQYRKVHQSSIKRLLRELDIVSFVRDQRLSSFAHKLTMSGH